MKEVSLSCHLYITKGRILVEVFCFFFSPGCICIFKVYSLGPATSAVIVSIWKMCCEERNGAGLRTPAAEYSSWQSVWEGLCRKEIYSRSRATETSLECECKCSGEIAWATSLLVPRVSGVKLSVPAEEPVPVGRVSEGQGRGRQSFGEKKVDNILPFCRWPWQRSLFVLGLFFWSMRE